MRRHRKGEPNLHVSGIALTAYEMNFSTPEKSRSLELASVSARLMRDGAVEIDVLASGELGMKASATSSSCDAASDAGRAPRSSVMPKESSGGSTCRRRCVR